MSYVNVIRAWKDADYLGSLTAEQRARLPAHPSGAIEFQDRSLAEGLADVSLRRCFSPCHRCYSTGP